MAAVVPGPLGASDEELLVPYRDCHKQRAFEELVHRYENGLYRYGSVHKFRNSTNTRIAWFLGIQTTCV